MGRKNIKNYTNKNVFIRKVKKIPPSPSGSLRVIASLITNIKERSNNVSGRMSGKKPPESGFTSYYHEVMVTSPGSEPVSYFTEPDKQFVIFFIYLTISTLPICASFLSFFSQ